MDVEAIPGTPNWHAARRGLLTASRVADALATLKNGKPAESRRKLMFDLLAERMTGIVIGHYVTEAMQWGIDTQSQAIAAYEDATGAMVGPEVFVLHPEIDWCGATPDGTVGNDGLVEVKCPTTPKHLMWKAAGTVPDEHRMQMVLQLAVTRREWCDFVSFDPRIAGKAKLFICRFVPDAGEIERVEAGVRQFLDELAAMEMQMEAA